MNQEPKNKRPSNQDLDNRLDESLFFKGAMATRGQLRGMVRMNHAARQFDNNTDYTIEQILDTLRREKVIGEGWLGKLHFYWLNLKGMETEYTKWLRFKRQPNGYYRTKYSVEGFGP